MVKSFVRGGQVALHSLRMFTQVFKVTLCIALVIFVLTGFSFFLYRASPYQIILMWTSWKIEVRQLIQIRERDDLKYHIPFPNDRSRLMTYRLFKHNPVIKSYLNRAYKNLQWSLQRGFAVTGFLYVLILGFFIWRGRQKYEDKILRGNRVVSSEELTRIIQEKKLDSPLNIDGLPLIRDRETSHFLVTGTTGSGKTNLFRTLLPQIRDLHHRAVVLDTTGDMVEMFYDPEHDILLNPLDERSLPWDIFNECNTQTEREGLAEALIPSGTFQGDQFWDEAARAVFSSALNKLKEEGNESIDKLMDVLLTSSLSDYEEFFKGTSATSFTDARADKTTLSIRSNLSSKLLWLRYMRESRENALSISKWIELDRPQQWLFISVEKKDLTALRPLISAWFNIAITSLLSLSTNEKRRLWFIIDELASLQKLPALEMGLAEARKYGGCFLVGTQSVSQLNRLYGTHMAHSCLDLFNTRFFFRSNDSDTTQWISKALGDAEIEESIENISYGANTIRDGVSLNHSKRLRSLVLPSEIVALKNLECYVRLPEGLPITRLKTTYKIPLVRNIRFCPWI